MSGFVVCERATGLIIGHSVVEPTHDASTHVVLEGFDAMPDPTTNRWDGADGLRAAKPNEETEERTRTKSNLKKEVRTVLRDMAIDGGPAQMVVVAMMEAIRRGTLTNGMSRQEAIEALAAEVDTLVP